MGGEYHRICYTYLLKHFCMDVDIFLNGQRCIFTAYILLAYSTVQYGTVQRPFVDRPAALSAVSLSWLGRILNQRPCITRRWTPAVLCLGWLDIF
jgi:hypothetical protein